MSDTNRNVETNGNGKNRPAYFVKCFSDRSTQLECAVWPYETVLQDGTVLIRYGVVSSRSYKDSKTGLWHNPDKDASGKMLNSMFSVHDIPVLLYLQNKCLDWCLQQRTNENGARTASPT